MRGRILVVDDDEDCAVLSAEVLVSRGFRATPVLDPSEAIEQAMDPDVSAVLTDLQMQTMDGLALCERIVGSRPDLPVLVITGHASIDAAVGALRAGAFDFIVKPIDADRLAITVDRALQHQRMKTELQRLRMQVATQDGFGELLGTSAAMRRVRDVIARIAPTQATVLVTGESGTGKELVARAIHEQSGRGSAPFVAINCAAVPAELLESELFGHSKGSFTDAKTTRRGLFAEAQGGTLFLDEIGEMPLAMQAKLLRALQERKIRPVGGNTEIPFDARVVAATNRDLEKEVREKRFREDLYYRIHVCSVEVPTLREREGDVALLARTFVKRMAERHRKPIVDIAPPALAKLVEYHWPGNVRELENGIERAVAMAQYDQLVVGDLPEKVRAYRPEVSATALPSVANELVSAAELERRYILHVLDLAKGNKSKAARILGYDRRTLYRKLERLESGEAEGSVADGGEDLPEPSDSTPPPARAEGVSSETKRASSASPSNPPGTFSDDPAQSPDRLKVLVVDDDDESRETVSLLLSARGFDVRTASGLVAAISDRGDVDVVLTDVHLGDGLGTALIGRFGETPVVAMSGAPQSDFVDAGFVDWIRKPVSLERLTSAVRSAYSAAHV